MHPLYYALRPQPKLRRCAFADRYTQAPVLFTSRCWATSDAKQIHWRYTQLRPSTYRTTCGTECQRKYHYCNHCALLLCNSHLLPREACV